MVNNYRMVETVVRSDMGRGHVFERFRIAERETEAGRTNDV